MDCPGTAPVVNTLVAIVSEHFSVDETMRKRLQIQFTRTLRDATPSKHRCNICGGVVYFDGMPPVDGCWGHIK